MKIIIYLIIILFLGSCGSSHYLPFAPQEQGKKLPTKKNVEVHNSRKWIIRNYGNEGR